MQRKIIDFLKTELASGVFFIVVGLFLTFFPVAAVNVICKIVFGLLLIITGLYNIFMYISEKAETTVLNMFSGVIVLVLGWFLFSNPQIVVRLLAPLLGSLILIDSVWLLRLAFKFRKKNIEKWNYYLIIGLVCIIFGLVIIVNPFSKVRQTVIFSGIVFLVNGIVDIIVYIFTKKYQTQAGSEAGTDEGETHLAVKEDADSGNHSAWGETSGSNWQTPAEKSEEELEEWQD